MTDPAHDPIRASILVVDDRPDNLLVMEAVFNDATHYQLVTARSGPEAIELVKEKEFALILLDIQMPGMDGYETAKHIKALANGKTVPIIMLTAIYREDPDVLKGYAAGAIDYLCKPFNPEVLKAKVNVYANLYIKSRQVMMLQNMSFQEIEKQYGGRRKTPRNSSLDGTGSTPAFMHPPRNDKT